MTSSGLVRLSVPAGAVTDTSDQPNDASTSTDNTVTWRQPPAPPKPPGTRVTHSTVKSHKGTARLRFVGTGRHTGFQCALARGHAKLHFATCHSPKSYRHLASGSYRFQVRAVGPGGKDKTPARRHFTIKR
jgi:hypothetical protein